MIRPATVDDAERLADIHIASWQAAYTGLLDAAFLDGLSSEREERAGQWRDWLSTKSAGRLVLVAASADDTVAGFAHVGPAGDKDLDARSTAELYAMYLDPAYYRQGFGSELMGAVFEELRRRGLARACLWVMAENVAARAFYERHGWEPDGKTSDLCLGITIPSVRYRVAL